MSNISSIKLQTALVLLCALALVPLKTRAEEYPTRSIKLVVPFAPGGNTDVAGRLIAEGLTGELGQTVVVENKPGAGASLGAGFVAKSKADGYTLLLASSALTINPSIYAKVPYDMTKDFEPVGLAMTTSLVLVASNKLGVHSVAELIAKAKAEPGKLTFGSAGVGSGSHMAGELFNQVAGVKTLHVPYKGSGPATSAILTGDVDLTFTSQAGALPFYQAHQVAALVITGKAPSPLFPGVPTSEAAGLKDYEAGDWIGILAPAGTPKNVIDRLNSALVKWVNKPDAKARMAQQAFEARSSTPAEFGALIRSELVKWNRTAKAANIKPE